MFYFPNLRKKDFLAILVYFLLVLLFFFRFLTGQEILAFKDLSRYFYPLRHLMVEQVKSGILPLWNPYIFCGFPLLGSLQVNFFYPLTAIYYFLPFNFAFNYYIILHYFLAACFMYALLRHYRFRWFACFFGGLIFAFSGYLLSVSNMNTSLSSVIWLPLVLLFWDKVVNPHPRPLSQRQRGVLPPAYCLLLTNVLLTGVFLALMFLGGEPTIFYGTVLMMVGYLVLMNQDLTLRGILQGVGWLGLAVVIALGMISVQLFPFLELARLSDRVTLTQYEVVSTRSFPPREILTFIFPYFFGNQAQLGGYTETLLGKNIQDWLITPYFGILPLLFVFFAFRAPEKKTWFFGGVAFLSLLFAFGRYFPLYRIAYQLLFGMALIRYPVKFLFLTNFCLVLLGALGWNKFLEELERREAKLKRVSFFLLLFSLGLLASYFALQINFSSILKLFVSKYPPNLPQIFFDRLAAIIQFDVQSLLFWAVFLLLFSLFLLFYFWEKLRKGILLGAVVIMTIADLFANGTSVTLGAPLEVYRKVPESYTFLLKDKEPYRFFYTEDLEKENRLIYGENYGAALYAAKERFCANWPVLYHLFDFYGYESIRPQTLADFIPKHLWGSNLSKNFHYLSLYNVKYIASTKKLNYPHLKLLFHMYKYGVNLYLYENKKVLPRAYLLDEESKPNFNLGQVVITNYQANQVVISVDLKKSGLLFLSDAYYPGWKGYVDGKEKRIIKANDLFRAVEVPSGKHEVKFVYAPLSFKLGALTSLFFVLLVAFLLLILRIKKCAKEDSNPQPTD